MTLPTRIAKAIYESRNGSGAKPWGHLPEAHQAPYLDDARAAMREMGRGYDQTALGTAAAEARAAVARLRDAIERADG